MRALIVHANHFRSGVEKKSSHVSEAACEELRKKEDSMNECVVAFIHIEKKDGAKQCTQLGKAIQKIAAEWNTFNILLSGFAHLSSDHADPEIAKQMCENIITFFTEKPEYVTDSSHFGYDKNLLLDVKGHPGSFKFRRF